MAHLRVAGHGSAQHSNGPIGHNDGSGRVAPARDTAVHRRATLSTAQQRPDWALNEHRDAAHCKSEHCAAEHGNGPTGHTWTKQYCLGAAWHGFAKRRGAQHSNGPTGH